MLGTGWIKAGTQKATSFMDMLTDYESLRIFGFKELLQFLFKLDCYER